MMVTERFRLRAIKMWVRGSEEYNAVQILQRILITVGGTCVRCIHLGMASLPRAAYKTYEVELLH